jgi:CMP-N,N'-diacetyllegionaminic acid synthase
MSRLLAIIPARGGSKGIPMKNLRAVGGVPLIGITIRAALGAKSISHCLVSTDSPEIAEYATSAGLPTQRLRPADLASDSALSSDVVRYEINAYMKESGEGCEHVMLLQPTAPLRTTRHIDEAFSRYLAEGAHSLISVCEVGSAHPEYMYRVTGGRGRKFLEGRVGNPRQDLERLYLRNGAIYITSVAYLLETGNLVSPDPALYLMERRCSINIDEPEDLLIAEAMLNLVG